MMALFFIQISAFSLQRITPSEKYICDVDTYYILLAKLICNYCPFVLFCTCFLTAISETEAVLKITFSVCNRYLLKSHLLNRSIVRNITDILAFCGYYGDSVAS